MKGALINKINLKKIELTVIGAIIALGLDMMTKYLAVEQNRVVWSRGWLGNFYLYFLLAAIFIVVLIRNFKLQPIYHILYPSILILAGVAGNLLSFIIYKAIPDFIKLPFTNIYFNLADIWIGLGILLLLKLNFQFSMFNWKLGNRI